VAGALYLRFRTLDDNASRLYGFIVNNGDAPNSASRLTRSGELLGHYRARILLRSR
jgi:hypothetical protein